MLKSAAQTAVLPQHLLNTCRRFGPFGPVYQIMRISRQLEDGEVLMNVHIFENNEDVEYPLSHILKDPLEVN